MPQTNVTFAKKTQDDYASGEKISGRIYFTKQPETPAGAKIYLDGAIYGEKNNLSDAAAAHYQQQYENKIASDAENAAKNKFSVTATASPSSKTLFAGTALTYTITVKYDNVGVAPTSGTPTGFGASGTTGVYTTQRNVNNSFVNNVPSISNLTITYAIPGTAYTASKNVNFAEVNFYNPILWGTVYDDGTVVNRPNSLSALETYRVYESSTPKNEYVMTGEHFNFRLNRASSVASSYKNLSPLTFNVHTTGAKFVVLLPKEVSGWSRAVTGSGYSSLEYNVNGFTHLFKNYSNVWPLTDYTVFIYDVEQSEGSNVTFKAQ